MAVNNQIPQAQEKRGMSSMAMVVMLLVLAAVGAGGYYVGVLSVQEPAPSQIGRVSGEQRPPLPEGLTDEQRQALALPGENSTMEDEIVHFQLVERIAEEADAMVFVNCVADPIIFKVGVGEEFSAENAGGEGITVSIQDREFRIAAGGSQTLVGGFGIEDVNRPTGTGLYEVSCSSPNTGGTALILVTD
ncbi:MAG: hypothetical protein Q8P12_02845 [bacterium]|nr:hypothetical protein [bacterium]